MKITEMHMMCLLGVKKKKSFTQLCEDTGKSRHWISLKMAELEAAGYVKNPPLPKGRKKPLPAARTLTSRGEELLKKNNLK